MFAKPLQLVMINTNLQSISGKLTIKSGIFLFSCNHNNFVLYAAWPGVHALALHLVSNCNVQNLCQT